ncbi:MAG: hypothetical protein C4531_09140 [Desulfurivibrio sp.]|jgi:hypothetical protein|nr:MAG: hypothetical protein C4531_09140 [Desulfurivibrio sp.]
MRRQTTDFYPDDFTGMAGQFVPLPRSTFPGGGQQINSPPFSSWRPAENLHRRRLGTKPGLSQYLIKFNLLPALPALRQQVSSHYFSAEMIIY